MQTQSIKNQSTNQLQPPKSAPLPSNDFKNALTLEIERAPVCAAPEQPAQSQARTPAKNAQPAKPAQQANGANKSQDAGQASEADASTGASETAATDAKPATAAQPAGEKDEADDSVVADPAAGMLAMLAAYGQLTAKEELATGSDAAGSDSAAALAALQADAAGKATLADLATQARGTEGTSALQDALSEQAGAERMLKAGAGLELGADQKARDFAAKLAENAAASAAASVADTAPAAQPVVAPAAQALAATVQAANAMAASQLQARVGTNAWEQQLGQKVVWMVAGGDQSASLTLNPPDLGPLQVVLNVSNDSATATFTAHQAETRQAIENALPKLREMMSEAGIMLGDASVSAGSQEQQQAFARQAGGSGGGRYGNGGDAAAQEEGQPVIRRTVLGAVDTFA